MDVGNQLTVRDVINITSQSLAVVCAIAGTGALFASIILGSIPPVGVIVGVSFLAAAIILYGIACIAFLVDHATRPQFTNLAPQE